MQSSNFACNEVSGTRQVLTAPIYGTMTDNSDGTYSYDFSIPLDGPVTVLVSLMNGGGVYSEWFANSSWSGTPVKKNVTSNIEFQWSSSDDLIPGRDNHVSAKFYAKIKPPFTETYTFNMIHDDGSKLVLGGETKINQQGTS